MTRLRAGCIRAAWSLALGALAFVPRAWGQTVVVGPRASSMSTVPGASITVPVVADMTSSGGASLGSIAARLTWRPGTLQLVGTSLGSAGTPVVNADSAAQGILKFAVADAAGATGMPVLINATFNVSGPAADTTTLGFSVGEISAAGSFADLKPITSATSARFCVSTGLYGDLDGDAAFTGHDALIVLTNAVGLPVAPYSVVNGDVDGNGVVDSRDALIVLSAAVGIPVSQFRIGRLNPGSCSLHNAATVQIQPRTPSVAPGDSLPVTATVRDSAGGIVQGVGLVWHSKDATIVRASANGSLVAVAPGSTFASVAVAPGVIDSILVVVSSVRHVWYVNPAVAAGNAVELGSQVYPFSAIHSGDSAAAAGDTVRVAVADYGEPVRITKPLALLGDSTAAGFPRIHNGAGPALAIDSVPSGAVRIHGLRLLGSLGGISADSVPILAVSAVNVEGSQGVGIRVHNADSVMLSRSSVAGAVKHGIELVGVRQAVLDHVTSGAVLQGPALLVNANSISVVGSDFSGATPGNGVPQSGDAESYAVSLNVAPAGTLRFDSSRVHDNTLFGMLVEGGAANSFRADTVARNYSGSSDDASSAFYDFGWLRLAGSAFLNDGPGYVDIEGFGADSVTADSVVFDGTTVYVYDVTAFRMHGGALRRGVAPTLSLDYVSLVELDSVEASGAIATGNDLANTAVSIYGADTATVTGMNAHDNEGGALGVLYTPALRVDGGTLLRNTFRQVGEGLRATLVAYYVTDSRISGLTLRDTADIGIYVVPSGNSRTVVDNSKLQGSRTLVQDWYGSAPNADTLIVSHSWLTGFGGRSVLGIDAQYLAKLAVTGNLIDLINDGAGDGNGVKTYGVDTTLASGNTISNWGNAGLNLTLGALTADTNVFAGCSPQGSSAIYSYQPDSASVVGNSLTGCGGLVVVYGPLHASGPAVAVLGNTVTRDSTLTQPGVRLQNGLGYVQVAGNTFSGGGSPAVIVSGDGYMIDSARVDSNTIRQVNTNGLEADNITKLTLTYNLVADNNGAGLIFYTPFSAQYNTVVRNVGAGVSDNSGGGSSFRYGNVVGNLPFGVVSNGEGMAADNNWWGDSRGPQCVDCSASTGDSVSPSVSFEPFAESVVALAPAIPGPPLGAHAFRPLAARSPVVPRARQATQGVRRAAPAPHAVAQFIPYPAPRPIGRVRGQRHRPAWKTGGLR